MTNPIQQLDSELHEQVYCWETEEDIWGSLKDVGQTAKARSALIEAFDPSKPIGERSMDQLRKALAVLEEIAGSPNATDWSECNELDRTMPGSQVYLRANTVLLLYRHLLWVWDVFKQVPGASVTVR